MRKVVLVLALLLVVSAAAYCANDSAFVGIFAETSLMKVPGLPDMSKMMANVDEKEIARNPAMANILSMGKPHRGLSVKLYSPGIAPADAFAYITPPTGLKQGDRMDLELYRPEPEKADAKDAGKDGEIGGGEFPKITMLIYWGSSEKVRTGQPKVITSDAMSDAQKKTLLAKAKEAQRAQGGNPYFYKPDWTTGHWPTAKQPGVIAKDASLVGNIALTTSFCGNVAIDVPRNVDFLAPIELSSPDMSKKVSLDSFVPLKWKTIPNVLGLHATAMGMKGKDTIVMWSSSEVEADFAIDWNYLQMADVLKYVKATIMMKGDRTDCTIPEAIFKDCNMVTFNMIGYGPGTALDKVQPIPRVQTKTTLTVAPFGGKDIPEIQGAPEGDEPAQPSIDTGDDESKPAADDKPDVTPPPTEEKKAPKVKLPKLGDILKH